MKRLIVAEHTRIERGLQSSSEPNGPCLSEHHYDRLRSFDRDRRSQQDRVFEWCDGYARTTQWVGVVQIPGLQIEILPKTDVLAGEASKPQPDEAQRSARCNLLYMLSVSGDVPVRTRDVARLAARQAPLPETLCALFAERLSQELLRGTLRTYQEHESNLRRFKGKLSVARQVVQNAAHRERFYCRFDEFTDDILINRIFRYTCRILLDATRSPATQDRLRQCLLLLDDVTDIEVQDADFQRITIDRQNERFEDILRFCRLVLAGRTPTIKAGGTLTFSLLFDMNKVFERFVVATLRRYVAPRLVGVQVHPHAGHHKRHLMESDGTGVLRLEPDVLVEAPGGRRLVLDTKWKLLAPAKRGRGGVSEADLYQLFAYTRRYGCARSVLLYPHTPGLEPRDFDVLDAEGVKGERVAVRLVNLNRDLLDADHRVALAWELEAIVREGLDLRDAGALEAVDTGGTA